MLVEDVKIEGMTTQQIQCTGIVLCAKTSVHEKTEMLSLIDLVQHIFLTIKPEAVATIGTRPYPSELPLDIVVFWERELNFEEEIQLGFKIELLDPKGKVLVDDMRSDISLDTQMRKFYSVLNFAEGILCTHQGLYSIRVVSESPEKTGGETVLKEDHLEVVFLDQEGARL